MYCEAIEKDNTHQIVWMHKKDFLATVTMKVESELSSLLYIYGTNCVGRLGIEQTNEQHIGGATKVESELCTLLYIYGNTCVFRLGIEQTDEQPHSSHHTADREGTVYFIVYLWLYLCR